MKEVVIAGYLRSAQSRSNPKNPDKDVFGTMRADEILARVVDNLLEKTGTDSRELDDFIVGSAMGVTEQWTFGGRTPLFLANISRDVPAKFIDQQCGSGMAALQTGFMEIATGFADTVLATGMEHMTRVPMGPSLFDQGVLKLHPDLSTLEKYRHWELATTMNMGLTAEKLFDQTDITREEMDQWSVRSHQLAWQAIQQGFFDGEIVPITPARGDKPITRDMNVRENASLETMGGLKPVFKKNGVITPGNASPLNAGAGAMLLMSREAAEKKGITPLATIRSIGFAGVDPTIMGQGPVPATEMALEKAGLQASDIDFWEINEAFAIVALNCIQHFTIDPDRVNIKGGGIALGHALGATGIRIAGTLARILEQENGRLGCANACIGGGQGTAVIIERP
ncbi:MAG TPA: acetyl-CoA C-acetyltransferase [Desulfobacteraceae bacterium]|nr:acetyl-CoA C-acetyltransferase [Desulfobacteraceae bacterium]